LIAIAVLNLVAQLVFGQSSLESGKHAFERFDFEAAFKILKPLADAGNTEAQELIGEVCGFGYPKTTTKTPKQDDLCPRAQSIRWYRLAAQKGNPKAQCNLGIALSLDNEKKRVRGIQVDAPVCGARLPRLYV
jgi:TPR repeat protein